MITPTRMELVDSNAAALGVPRKQLMESSGNAVARTVRDRIESDANTTDDSDASVTLICGRGNNGGDAFVAARFLEEFDLRVVLLGRPETISTDIARENWDALHRAELPVEVCTDSRSFTLDGPKGSDRESDDPESGGPNSGDPDIVVDAMLGTGVTGALREPEATVARRLNESEATVVAVDVPSGIDGETGEASGDAVEADHVVTFHDMKPGLVDLDAEVTVADIGIPEAAELYTGPGYLAAIDRDPTSHKGENGEVLVIGGGPFTGAPAFATEAAFRTGCDLVTLAVPTSIVPVEQGYAADFMVRGLSGDRIGTDHVEDLLSFAEGKDVVAVGPGLGDDEDTVDAVGRFLSRYEGKAVVDADGLRAVPDADTDADLVCTPNGHELAEMGCDASDDLAERMGQVEAFAADLGQVVLAKGSHDVISDGERTVVNRVGNPGMTVGGTGDVLTGVISAFWATLPAMDAAATATFVTGRAGNLAREELGDGFLASDMVKRVPHAMQRDE